MHRVHPSASGLDLNLLTALDALLTEESVTGAARRLHLSEPAMSRTLGRIRKALGDPVLVRSGRRMVPTPRAVALRGEVREVLRRARGVFAPPDTLEPATLERTFTLLADDTLLTVIGMRLLARIRREAPGVSLRLLPEGPDDSHALRDGRVDLDLGVVTDVTPETRVEPLFTDDNAGVVRAGHPLLDGPVTPGRFAAADHVTASRRGRLRGPIDEALDALGLRRRVVASVPTLAAALLMTAHTDLVARTARRLSALQIERLGLVAFTIPLDLPPVPISQAWHARWDADPAHRWLRARIREIAADLGGTEAAGEAPDEGSGVLSG
ncbi:LysR family transcriptional regulator [Streptomyces sp. DSM 44917]|uniref:LysR family transcriptional regulator n=1 Tax=Streptomyces boetiae TaxID=3075541 RepID=A0ABU2L8I4_9ACTN|nr:LysR family transcriptional regulator [Streptomyces sp. DSM 44917]MDT0307874.1 LysR family transcriptional regulator [Streptomyces sp. DSM 44917]